MVRCGCATSQCSCVILAGENVSVSGTGSAGNPYVIEAATSVILEEGGGGGVSRLVGEIVAYGGAAAPAGWLICDGAEVNRVVYSDLFAVLGTTHGAGDGESTFTLPDLVGRVPRGSTTDAPRGTEGGDDEVTLSTAQLPAHSHTINHTHLGTNSGGTHDHPLQRSSGTGGSVTTIPRGTSTVETVSTSAIQVDGSHTHSIPPFLGSSGSKGDGDPVSLLPSFVSVNYIIRT